MRELFPGYYKPSSEEFKKLWEKGIIVFDTNVLHDLYRYSEDTVKILLSIMDSVKDRIWIPYQVSKEYHKNLNGIISGQVNKYQDSIKTLQDFKRQIEEKRNHPFLNPELHKEINDFCKKFDSELDLKKDKVKSLINENPIKEKLADLLDDKVGEKFSEEQLQKIFEEGERRYKSNIPPGYKDAKKHGVEKFGDLVLWKEILEKNKNHDKPLIFITGDKKEDWFQIEMGLTIGPRPELIDEFFGVKKNLFYCYPTDSFLKYAKEYLDIEINDSILEEVGELLSRDITSNEEISESGSSTIQSNETSSSTNSSSESQSSESQSSGSGLGEV